MAFDTFPPATQVPGLVARKDPNLNIGPGSSSNPYLVYNTVSSSNSGAMQDVAFRQALSTGINRANLISLNRMGCKSLCWVPLGMMTLRVILCWRRCCGYAGITGSNAPWCPCWMGRRSTAC